MLAEGCAVGRAVVGEAEQAVIPSVNATAAAARIDFTSEVSKFGLGDEGCDGPVYCQTPRTLILTRTGLVRFCVMNG
jgi:hypothetical protein